MKPNPTTPQPSDLSAKLDEARAMIEYHQKRLDDTWAELGVHVGELRYWQMKVRELGGEMMGIEAFEEFIRGMR